MMRHARAKSAAVCVVPVVRRSGMSVVSRNTTNCSVSGSIMLDAPIVAVQDGQVLGHLVEDPHVLGTSVNEMLDRL